MTLTSRLCLIAPLSGVLALAIASPALAHTGHGDASGFLHGLAHPVSGADHLLAMLAVGLWSGFVMPRRIWAGAASFMAAMALGAGVAGAGIAVPMVEAAILTSVLAFGLLVALARPGQPAALTAAALAAIAGFGAAHGFAHGAEASGSALGYGAGFLATTAALHLAGIALARRLSGDHATALAQRGLGAAITLGGLALLAG